MAPRMLTPSELALWEIRNLYSSKFTRYIIYICMLNLLPDSEASAGKHLVTTSESLLLWTLIHAPVDSFGKYQNLTVQVGNPIMAFL